MNFYVLFTLAMGLVLLLRMKNKKFSLFLLLLLFSLSAFRGENVGNDTVTYMDESNIYYKATTLSDFNNLEFNDFGNKVEILNNLLNRLVYVIDLDPRFILIFYSIIMMFFLYHALKRFNVSISYALAFYVLLGFFYYSFNIARQLCSASLLLYAYSFIQDKEKRKYLFFLWVFIASLIHSFSLIFLVVFFVRFIPRINKTVGVFFFIASLFFVTVKIDMINQLSIFLDVEHISSLVDSYGSLGGLNIYGIVINWINLSFLFYFFIKSCDNDKIQIDTFVSNLYIISIFLFGLLVNYDGPIKRFGLNVNIIQCVFIPLLISSPYRSKLSFDKLMILMLICLCAFNNASFISSGDTNYYFGF